MRVRSSGSVMQAQGHAILRADRAFFDGRRAEILAEREAIAISLDQAGKHVEADLVRGRPQPPEWRKP